MLSNAIYLLNNIPARVIKRQTARFDVTVIVFLATTDAADVNLSSYPLAK